MQVGKWYCVGCFRTQDEIRDWFTATDTDKLRILERINNEAIHS